MPSLNNAYALVVGISQYRNVRELPQSVLTDAGKIYDVLIDESLCAYPATNVQLLLDDAATQAGLRQALSHLAANTNADSTIFIYFSGHGGRIEAGAHAGEYIVPVDAVAKTDVELAKSCISGVEFSEALRRIPARRLVVIFDCCHAGGIGEPKDLGALEFKALSEHYYDTLKSGRGRVIFSSSRSTELSWILDGASHSLFTQHLLDGLRGGASGAGGVIRIFDLFDYVQPRVTRDQPNQHPLFKAEIEENFAIALFKGGTKEVVVALPLSSDGYEYDAFISYSEDKVDRRWVRDLVARFDKQNFNVAVDFRAPLGIPKITFSEQAVQQSRYTLVVLSPAYIESGYAEFQSLLAQHLGQEESQYRVIPVMIEECTPRLGLRILPILDMTNNEDFELNLERLVDYLRQPPTRRP